MDNPVLPEKEDWAVKKAVRDIKKERIKTADEKHDELWHALSGSRAWLGALKPYLETRIKTLKEMADVELTGGEDLKEIGLKFLVSSLVANELQAILNRVETTTKMIDERRAKEKHGKKKG